jgi:hypothetical protein
MRAHDTIARADEGLDALALIRKDHIRITELLQELAGGSSRPRARRRRFARLANMLDAHERMEEEAFYPAMGRHPDGAGTISECLLEHRAVDILVARVDELGADDQSWPSTARALADAVHLHFEHEQGMLLPLARRIFDTGELHELAAAMLAQRRSRPSQERLGANARDSSQPGSQAAAHGRATPGAKAPRGAPRSSDARSRRP